MMHQALLVLVCTALLATHTMAKGKYSTIKAPSATLACPAVHQRLQEQSAKSITSLHVSITCAAACDAPTLLAEPADVAVVLLQPAGVNMGKRPHRLSLYQQSEWFYHHRPVTPVNSVPQTFNWCV
jgi:hypothetical protein